MCWSSSVVEHVLGKDGVTGSIPVSSSSDNDTVLSGRFIIHNAKEELRNGEAQV